MNKQEIMERFIARLSDELDALTEATKKTIATATDGEHVARSKYETFGLESSYLARGQAQRVEELTFGLEQLKGLQLEATSKSVLLGALIRLEEVDGDEVRNLFLVPSAGGEELEVEGEMVLLITPTSPVGKSIVGKKPGDLIEMGAGFEAQRFRIESVS